jgi:hypothetical protein
LLAGVKVTCHPRSSLSVRPSPSVSTSSSPLGGVPVKVAWAGSIRWGPEIVGGARVAGQVGEVERRQRVGQLVLGAGGQLDELAVAVGELGLRCILTRLGSEDTRVPASGSASSA